MYSTKSRNEHVEDKSPQSSPTPQILKDSREIKEIALSKTEERTPKKKKLQIPCPPQGTLNKVITDGIILILVWSVAWSFLGSEVLPGGNLFGLLVIFYCSLLGGKLLEIIKIPSVPQLPPLLGMLLGGFTIRNIPFISQHVKINSVWSSSLRNAALTVILIRAGLGLDPKVLKELKKVCVRLSIGPCLIEACSAAFFSHLIMKFPWQWAFLLGFTLGAVSPAVVVPSMLFLQEHGYGVKKGIPTLLVAASSIDDIVAITGFNACMGIVFSSGDLLTTLLNSLWEVILGVLLGVVLGIFLQYFPNRDQTKLEWKRSFLILGLCITAVLGSHRVGLHGAGGLCTLLLTFVAGLKWSKEKIYTGIFIAAIFIIAKKVEKSKCPSTGEWINKWYIQSMGYYSAMKRNKVRVQKIIAGTWNIFQPLLFGLVGAEVPVSSLRANAIGICVATVSLALLVRICATFFLMSFAGFSLKEKIFIALSWMPKATVQAVLGPLALETARISAPHLEEYSENVMTTAFLAILITAPNGALIIGLLGPKILTHSDPRLYKSSIDMRLAH